MGKLDPIDEFVREQLASGRFSDYEALVRYALASLESELCERSDDSIRTFPFRNHRLYYAIRLEEVRIIRTLDVRQDRDANM